MSDLTPNHTAGQPLEPIDAEKLAQLAQKNIDNPEGGRKKIRTHTEADGNRPGRPRRLHLRGHPGDRHPPGRHPD